MARTGKRRQVLPFRIPFFRIFYSTTYTTLFIICLAFLAITPGSLIFAAIENSAYQYTIMIGGVYILTALIAIFIYTSRLYTNRTALAGVGKAYIPVEDGDIGKSVRKMIVKQLRRSAIVAWEARPRDVMGEILEAEELGTLPPETVDLGHNDYTVGEIIPVNPEKPPWGDVRHAGWSSPSHVDNNINPDVRFASVIQELPHLIEARAVSLAPMDDALGSAGGVDPYVVDLLRRPQTMGLRDYLTQLSYLRLIDPPGIGQRFLRQYESARFCGRPATDADFATLMNTFSDLLAGMTILDEKIVEQIRAQSAGMDTMSDVIIPPFNVPATPYQRLNSSSRGSVILASSENSPVTAKTRLSRNATPYLHPELPSNESFTSVLRKTPTATQGDDTSFLRPTPPGSISRSMSSVPSDTGSVLHHEVDDEPD